MMGTPATSGATRFALVGLVLLLPALLFELVGASSVWAPGNGVYRWFETSLRDPGAFRAFNLLSPILFLGGSLAALVLNMSPIARLSVRRDVGELVGLVRYRGHRANVAVVAMSLLVLVVLLLYLLLENGPCSIGQKATC
jgi:hypothetical protein